MLIGLMMQHAPWKKFNLYIVYCPPSKVKIVSEDCFIH